MSDRVELTHEVGAMAWRTAPGGIGTVAYWGDWIGLVVGILTMIFLLMQIGHFVWKNWLRPKPPPEPWI